MKTTLDLSVNVMLVILFALTKARRFSSLSDAVPSIIAVDTMKCSRILMFLRIMPTWMLYVSRKLSPIRIYVSINNSITFPAQYLYVTGFSHHMQSKIFDSSFVCTLTTQNTLFFVTGDCLFLCHLHFCFMFAQLFYIQFDTTKSINYYF